MASSTNMNEMGLYIGGEAVDANAIEAAAKDLACAPRGAQQSLRIYNKEDRQRVHHSSEQQDNACDSWKVNNEKLIVREHLRPRCELFSPCGVKDSPKIKDLLPIRVTIGRFLDTNKVFRVADAWTTRSTAHCKLASPWVGTTAFVKRCGSEGFCDRSCLNMFTLSGASRPGLQGYNQTCAASTEGRFEFIGLPTAYRISNAAYTYCLYSLNTYRRSIKCIMSESVRVAEGCLADVCLDMHAHAFARNIYTQSIL